MDSTHYCFLGGKISLDINQRILKDRRYPKICTSSSQMRDAGISFGLEERVIFTRTTTASSGTAIAFGLRVAVLVRGIVKI